ncbi:GNAT family N-acetyltransferase [Streptomyces sp. CNQ085]|uniref:GNAT family N-acetyltransferase n=1 Tax=Streptomyces sp. CNQ085 TaxID=2886944 RepID=UPI001F50596B|nr:GNAT family N-acetyltransferase [Streptomyces sp. CNQ085]MCI0385238.1 GNAT family N-acetyltransferase [Streptomyces sp. CNQ085]
MEFTMGGRLELRISADDVGKRVSVRSLTGSAQNGAAFTDTVGVLTSWKDGVLSVTRRGGQSVAIEESALVAGKTVPAEPARRRGPAAGVRELAEAAARGWPAVETARLGGWLLRASGGFTGRANSVLPLGDPGTDLDAALAEVVRWYGGRGLPALVQIATGAAGADELLADGLERRGWTAERFAVLCTGALAPLADREPDGRVRLSRRPDAVWLSGYGRGTPDTADDALKVLAGGPSVWFATVPGDDSSSTPAAIGRCVVDGRWAGFAAVETTPERRREGLATAVMAELARTALAEGASAAYLQVEPDNTAARAMYARMGFTDHHSYHYRRAPRG